MRIDDPVLDRLDRSRRHVHDHEALAKVAGIGPQPDDIGLELLQARRRGHVERANVSLLTTPVWSRPLRAWKRLTAASTNESKTGPAPATGSRSPEATSRSRKAWTAPPFEPTLSSGPPAAVPAAVGDNVLIFLDGRLRRVDRRWRQDGGRLARDRHLRRRLVALRPFRLTDVLFLGLGRDRSQSNGESDACRRAKKCAARKPRDGLPRIKCKSPRTDGFRPEP